jgi:Tfp pilus assembly protein FimV
LTEEKVMIKGIRLVLLAALLLLFMVAAHAQTSAEQTASALRAQLTDVEAKQSALEERSRELDEELKPENIERSLALTGSTRPEELREQRRRELAKEKESVRTQLDQLAASRTRLEAAIATADAEAYRRSALVGGAAASTTTPVNPGSTRPAAAAQEPQQTPRRRRSNVRRRPRRHKT